MAVKKFEPRTAVVRIYTGDYLDRIRHLEQRALAAKEAEGDPASQALDEVPEYLTIAEEHDALVKEAEEKAAIDVQLQHIRRRTWRQLVSEHPPREGNRVDARYGVNLVTFRDALVVVDGRTKSGPDDEGIPFSTVIGPEWLTDDHLEDLSDGDFDRLFWTAFELNRGEVADPKASLVSRMTQTSDET